MNRQLEIKEFTKDDLSNPDIIMHVLQTVGKENQLEVIKELKEIAKEKKVLNKVNKYINESVNELKIINNEIQAVLILNQQGIAEPSVENYLKVMTEDDYVANLFYYDEFIGQIIHDDGSNSWWSDKDDSCLRAYIEKNYNIYNQLKYYDAFNTILNKKKKHPIKDIIEEKDWDGKHRIDKFLVDICGCEDDDYSREVSRMIFYGGINRLYNPGCKFDYVPIFISSQGSGKSSLVQWLALDVKYFKDLSSIEGKDGMEALDGTWVCELAELLAMVRTKEAEAMKAYISRTNDKYRKAYDKRVSNNPRQCIFIGTTNDYQFLGDKTGNRRYLPIELHIDGAELYKNEKQIRKYILECWREALDLMNEGKTYLTIDFKYKELLEERQAEVMMDDPQVGLITDYLDTKEVGYKVSSLELFTKALNGLRKNYTTSSGKEISRIMNNQKDWVKCPRFYSPEFKQQRGWEKVDKETIKENKKIKVEDDKWGDLE